MTFLLSLTGPANFFYLINKNAKREENKNIKRLPQKPNNNGFSLNSESTANFVYIYLTKTTQNLHKLCSTCTKPHKVKIEKSRSIESISRKVEVSHSGCIPIEL